jgi:predicted small metal-binding protein
MIHMVSLSCRDQGIDCEFRAEGGSPSETLSKFLAHAIESHAEFLGELRATMSEDEIRAMLLRQMNGQRPANRAF